jgi:hypothetical protein
VISRRNRKISNRRDFIFRDCFQARPVLKKNRANQISAGVRKKIPESLALRCQDKAGGTFVLITQFTVFILHGLKATQVIGREKPPCVIKQDAIFFKKNII